VGLGERPTFIFGKPIAIPFIEKRIKFEKNLLQILEINYISVNGFEQGVFIGAGNSPFLLFE